jgi:hypothetical protein
MKKYRLKGDHSVVGECDDPLSPDHVQIRFCGSHGWVSRMLFDRIFEPIPTEKDDDISQLRKQADRFGDYSYANLMRSAASTIEELRSKIKMTENAHFRDNRLVYPTDSFIREEVERLILFVENHKRDMGPLPGNILVGLRRMKSILDDHEAKT